MMQRNKNKAIWWFFILAIASTFLFSTYQIIVALYNYYQGIKTYNILASDIVIKNTETSKDDVTDIQLTTDKFEDSDENITNEIIPAPISVDFDALLDQNNDVVGWLYCENTPINYPIMQSTDNSYYLRRMINKEYNIAGSLFMDYRSNDDCTSLNTIIYGHNMDNGSMFGTFTKYNNQAYYDAHPILWLLTPYENFKIELIAGYVTISTSDVYKDYVIYNELEEHIEQSIKNSTFTSNIDDTNIDRIVTLSTCSYEYPNARYVLIGKLISLND